MKQLRVTTPFRDENNFFLMHKEGDVIAVDDSRAARLVKGGVCEEIQQEKKEKRQAEPKPEAKETAEAATQEPTAEPTREAVKRPRKTTKK